MLSIFCAFTVAFLVGRDVFVPHVRDTEVWLGFALHGWSAWLTAPLHWSIFGLGAWGFWSMRPWVWPWASVYVFYVAISHLIWNLASPSGGGWASGRWQFALFASAALVLLGARPTRPAPDASTPAA